MENLETITGKTSKPGEGSKYQSIFVGRQNGKVICLVKNCGYTFSYNMIKKNGKVIGYYN